MSTRGIEGLLIETHNWGKTVAFWKSLGYEVEFETDHHSGKLRHPGGGPGSSSQSVRSHTYSRSCLG